MFKINFFTLLTLPFVFVGCAHHADVRPGAKGIHRVLIRADDRDNGERDAVRQAKSYCDKRKVAFISESSKYTGTMSEKKYRHMKVGTNFGAAVGGALFTHGKGATSAAGALLGLGSLAGSDALGNAYTIDFKFKCI